MRNWNPGFQLGRALGFVFSAYLWGIETRRNSKRYGYHWSFQRTYEELKQKTWTTAKRSWKSFQRTYEELKQSMLAGAPSLNASFQRTYEELKLNSQVNHVPWLWRFQRTYEELKHMGWSIRNEMGGSFSAYLWGIETFLNRGGTPGRYQFSAYLWGIETYHTTTQSTLNPGFQRTYEELKQERDWHGNSRIWGFQRTYEELKRITKTARNGKRCPFSAYLWGIETRL